MDFNLKKLTSDAGVFFTRAVQFTEEKLGSAEKTELDAHLENLIARADCTKNWTEKIFRQTEVLLQPNPIDHTGARIEEFFYEKLDKKIPSRTTNGELLGQYMLDAAKDFGPGTPYGSTLITVGEYQSRLGGAEREFLQTSAINFLTPLRNFLEGDWRTISKERRLLENRRLDLDICKARVKKAKQAEAKAALWSEEVDKAEQELRVAQTEFDRQAEVTRLLLEGISSTHVNHLRCLHEFVEAQATYYAQCHQYMQELQKELSSANSDTYPNSFASNANPSTSATCPSPVSSATLPGVSPPCLASTSTPGIAREPSGPLKIQDVQQPSTGHRKAKVLYDYDAHDTSELSLLADELITVYTVPGMDPDWLVGERGNQKGKVPVTYLELLS
ncbi:endophilin-B2b isoform X13 [Oncorhynchus tshawytscha]|uniref:Endophilin-B2 n=1 Tax=Oncorhynchus tshawytscha TaxID=74940 RepID=A0A8C8F7F0_ONCTS|nr:endophilin-B2b isoform X13 [Oncorhynchus tshawytscha]XP_031658597.1 endophilin-B2 isoform X11 [Oncorhynchus kisutch]